MTDSSIMIIKHDIRCLQFAQSTAGLVNEILCETKRIIIIIILIIMNSDTE